VYTAPATILSAQTVTVRANSVADSTKSDNRDDFAGSNSIDLSNAFYSLAHRWTIHDIERHSHWLEQHQCDLDYVAADWNLIQRSLHGASAHRFRANHYG